MKHNVRRYANSKSSRKHRMVQPTAGTVKVHVKRSASGCIFNMSYLSKVQGDVHLVVLGAAGQRRALPPSLRTVNGVGDGMSTITVALATDVTVLALRSRRQTHIQALIFKTIKSLQCQTQKQFFRVWGHHQPVLSGKTEIKTALTWLKLELATLTMRYFMKSQRENKSFHESLSRWAPLSQHTREFCWVASTTAGSTVVFDWKEHLMCQFIKTSDCCTTPKAGESCIFERRHANDTQILQLCKTTLCIEHETPPV